MKGSRLRGTSRHFLSRPIPIPLCSCWLCLMLFWKDVIAWASRVPARNGAVREPSVTRLSGGPGTRRAQGGKGGGGDHARARGWGWGGVGWGGGDDIGMQKETMSPTCFGNFCQSLDNCTAESPVHNTIILTACCPSGLDNGKLAIGLRSELRH